MPASSPPNSSGSGRPNSHVVGFSGTNDNQLLLPLGVRQSDVPGQPLLAATNGKMLDMLLRTASYATLAPQVWARPRRACCSRRLRASWW